MNEGDRFITLTVHLKKLIQGDVHRHWVPYAEDFIQPDWELYSGHTPRAKPKNRYERVPVI